MAVTAQVSSSPKPKKKYQVIIRNKDGDVLKTVHFGDKRYGDFTTHGSDKRKESYLARHEPGQDWSINGVTTAGFWSRWLLWNKSSLRKSIKDLNRRFHKQMKINLK